MGQNYSENCQADPKAKCCDGGAIGEVKFHCPPQFSASDEVVLEQSQVNKSSAVGLMEVSTERTCASEADLGSTWREHILGYAKGRFRKPNGDRYEGERLDGRAHGHGKLSTVSINYEGQWENDYYHGRGVLHDADGVRYEGDFWCSQKHGNGIQTWPDGVSYEGLFDKGAKTGKATFKREDGSLMYKGNMLDDKMHGQGEYNYDDGRIYSGLWQAGVAHGKGVMIWSDGTEYVGGFVDGKRSGEGIVRYRDGRQYEGQWLGGKQHGKGTTVDSSGKKCEHQWLRGTREVTRHCSQVHPRVCTRDCL